MTCTQIGSLRKSKKCSQTAFLSEGAELSQNQSEHFQEQYRLHPRTDRKHNQILVDNSFTSTYIEYTSGDKQI